MIEAGVDQFGGEACPELIVELVRAGKVPEERIDESVSRLLREKFTLGLFDNPYLDPAESERVIGQATFREAGKQAQRRAYVLLKNGLREDAGRFTGTGRNRFDRRSQAGRLAQLLEDLI